MAITGYESALSRLAGQDQSLENVVAFVARSAMRALPDIATDKPAPLEQIALPTLRALLTSEVVAVCPQPDVKMRAAALSAANSTHTAAYGNSDADSRSYNHAHSAAYIACGVAAFSDAHSAADYAADAAYRPAQTVALHAAISDAKTIEAHGVNAVFSRVLWPEGGVPDFFAVPYSTLTQFWDGAPAVWGFWARWYEGMLYGAPMDWALQEAVALIPNKVWEAGAEAVAEEIRTVEEEFWTENLPQQEKLSQDKETGKFVVSASPFDEAEALERWLKQIEFALNLAVDTNTSEFNRMCTAYKYLNHTLENCRDDPNAIEQQVGIARGIIDENLARDGYQSDDNLNALSKVLEQIQVQMRADHPDVRKAWEKRIAQKLRETDRETKLAAAEAIRAEKERSLDRLNTEMELDAEAVETSDDPEVQAQAIRRSGGRAAKMNVLERAAGTVRKVDDSAGYKGVRIAGTGYTVGDILWMLANLFGG